MESFTWEVTGMNQDLSVSKIPNKYSYENINLRLSSNADNTLASIVNEQGNLLIESIEGLANGIEGNIIGTAKLTNYIILFTTENSVDRIYKIWEEDNIYKGELLFGNEFYHSLDFDTNYPIETLVYEESEENKTVYWVDGKNCLRYINIAASKEEVAKWNNESFNHVKKLEENKEVIRVEQDYNINGNFKSGAIQFIATYSYDSVESSIIWDSGLFYLATPLKGLDINSSVSCGFKFDISNLDLKAKYLNIYGLFRSSKEGVWECFKALKVDIDKIQSTPSSKPQPIQLKYGTPFEINTIAENILFHRVCDAQGMYVTAKTLFEQQNTASDFFAAFLSKSKNITREAFESLDLTSSSSVFKNAYSRLKSAIKTSSYYGINLIKSEMLAKYNKPFVPIDVFSENGFKGHNLKEPEGFVYYNGGGYTRGFRCELIKYKMLMLGGWYSYNKDNKTITNLPTLEVYNSPLDADKEGVYNAIGPGIDGKPKLPYNNQDGIDSILIKVPGDKGEITTYNIDLTTIKEERDPFWDKPTYNNIEKEYKKKEVELIPLISLTRDDDTHFKLWYLGHGCFDEVEYKGEQVFGNTDELAKGNPYIFSKPFTPTNFRPIGLNISVSLNTIKDTRFTVSNADTEIVDLNSLTLRSSNPLKAYTLEQKDNTLFLGKCTIDNYKINEELLDEIKKLKIEFVADKEFQLTESNLKRYPYRNQLIFGDRKIKTFKYLEWYRFGIQLQYNTGSLSEPIWLGDYRNETSIRNLDCTDNQYYLVRAKLTDDSITLFNSLISDLRANNVIGVKPLVIYTDQVTDSECICQGVVCPTLYQPKERQGDAGVYGCSSWFFRPNAPYDIKSNQNFSSAQVNAYFQNTGSNYPSGIGCMLDLNGDYFNNINVPPHIPHGIEYYPKVKGFYEKDSTNNEEGGVVNGYQPSYSRGSIVEFRDGAGLPTNEKTNCEIQVTSKGIDEYYNFHVDCNLITFHSPDIEFNIERFKHMNLDNVKFRITGYVPLTSNTGELDFDLPAITGITKSSSVNAGFNKCKVNETDSSSNAVNAPYRTGVLNVNNNIIAGLSYNNMNKTYGWKALISSPAWIDKGLGSDFWDTNDVAWVVYPWQTKGSIIGEKGYGEYNAKYLANLRFSLKSIYLNKESVWEPDNLPYTDSNNEKHYPKMSTVKIYDSIEDFGQIINIQKSSNSSDGILYRGSMDTLFYDGSNNTFNRMFYVPKGVYNNQYTTRTVTIASRNYLLYGYQSSNPEEYKGDEVNACRITYKSGTHAVFSINTDTSANYYRLPQLALNGNVINSGFLVNGQSAPSVTANGKATLPVGIDYINVDSNLDLGFLWLGELYRPVVTNRFGGEPGLQSNWLTGGPIVSIQDCSTLSWNEGDTYYQRYDHTKTLPIEDINGPKENNVREMISFLCETRVNLDGRTDNYRLPKYITHINDRNYNTLNFNYTQTNNAIIFKSIDKDSKLDKTGKFNNNIFWSLTKNIGEDLDSWLNIPTSSFLNLDGDKGNITKLIKFNNDLLAFQHRGISKILFNEQTLIPTSSGVPLEIANSGRLTGKIYLTNNVGCINKHSIVLGDNGIYFIDDYNKHAYLFNGELTNLSEKLGMNTFFNNHSSKSIWNPIDFNNCVVYRDMNNNDILYIYKDVCLAFSEKLGSFTSFYSYENTPYIINDNNHVLNIKYVNNSSKLWKQNEGKYNYFFGEFKPYSITLIANDKPNLDKTFTNLEFRADCWKDGRLADYNSSTKPFNTLEVYNEYQKGSLNLEHLINRPSSLKRKFRIWRADIPRVNAAKYGRPKQRIRNTWAYVKLFNSTPNYNKTILHDIAINYII